MLTVIKDKLPGSNKEIWETLFLVSKEKKIPLFRYCLKTIYRKEYLYFKENSN